MPFSQVPFRCIGAVPGYVGLIITCAWTPLFMKLLVMNEQIRQYVPSPRSYINLADFIVRHDYRLEGDLHQLNTTIDRSDAYNKLCAHVSLESLLKRRGLYSQRRRAERASVRETARNLELLNNEADESLDEQNAFIEFHASQGISPVRKRPQRPSQPTVTQMCPVLCVKALAEYLQYIVSNKTVYQSFFDWKPKLADSVRAIHRTSRQKLSKHTDHSIMRFHALFDPKAQYQLCTKPSPRAVDACRLCEQVAQLS